MRSHELIQSKVMTNESRRLDLDAWWGRKVCPCVLFCRERARQLTRCSW